MVPSITEIVSEYHRETEESLQRVAARSGSTGPPVSQAYLWRLEQGDVKSFPAKPRTVAALAEGLETTELAIVLGYAVSLGIPVQASELASRMPAAADDLPDDVKDQILRLVRVLVASYVERSESPGHERIPADDETPVFAHTDGLRPVRGPVHGHAQSVSD